MRVLAFWALTIVLLSVESVLVKAFGFEVTRVDVCVALLTFLGLRSTLMEGAFTAFSVGYLLDVFTGRPTGLYPFLAVLMFLLVKFSSQVIDARGRLSFGLTVAGATFVHVLLAFLFTWLTARSTGYVRSLAGLPLQVVLTGGIGALIFPWLKRLEPPERTQPGAYQ
jgi:hypothetical protein